MREFSLKTYINNKYVDSLITFHAEHGIVTVSYEAGGEKIIKQDAYPFLALVAIRKELEEREAKILCKGSQLNVYPSGAALSSLKAYELELGKSVGRENLVVIFDPVPDVSLIASIDEQKRFYNRWLESVNFPK
jgi:hypothetical protein